MSVIKKPEFMDMEDVYQVDGKWIYEENVSKEIKEMIDEYNKKIEKNRKKPIN